MQTYYMIVSLDLQRAMQTDIRVDANSVATIKHMLALEQQERSVEHLLETDEHSKLKDHRHLSDYSGQQTQDHTVL